MVLMRRVGTDSSVLSNTNPGNGSGWRRRLESSEQGQRQQSVGGGRSWTQGAAAAELQGTLGGSGHGCGKTGIQGTKGRG